MTRQRHPEGEGKCRTCGQVILWVKMVPSLAPTPLDPVPVPDGNVERRPGKLDRSTWYGRVVPQAERKGRLYVVHFRTCPQAGQHRRRR